MEAEVHLELLLEAEGLLLRRDQLTLLPLGKIGFAPLRSNSRNAGGSVRSCAECAHRVDE